MNQHTVVGRMVADAEEFGNPVAGCRFRIATDDYDPGQKARVTEYHDCKAFGKITNVVTQYAGKGRLVRLTGVVRTEKYTPSRGPHSGHETQSRVIIVNGSDGFELLGAGGATAAPSDDDSGPSSGW